MNDIENEVILLSASVNLITEIVNNNMLSIINQSNGFSAVRFESEEKFKLFCIYFADLFSKPDKKIINATNPYLKELLLISSKETETLNDKNSKLLNESVNEFRKWLNESVKIEKVWLPTVGLEVDITTTRYNILKLACNYQKHDFSRFGGSIDLIKDLLKEAGHEITVDQCVLIFDELIDNFFLPVVNYHSGCIVEFLNNIRCGIHNYLIPVYQEAYHYLGEDEGLPNYRYKIPKAIQSELIIGLFWDLMNRVRTRPYVEQFKLDPLYKKRY